jgi:8-oxo-dGTP diphosphatase
VDLGRGGFLRRYDPAAFPPLAVTVDVVVLTVRQGRLCALLVRRGEPPQRGRWALPRRFVRPDEDLDDAARARTARGGRPAGCRAPGAAAHLRRAGRDPRMRVVSRRLPGARPRRAGADGRHGRREARLWPVRGRARPARRRRGGSRRPRRARLRPRPILADAVERARSKLEYTSLAATFLEEPFTIADLRRVYEAVWGGGPLHARELPAQGALDARLRGPVPGGSAPPAAAGPSSTAVAGPAGSTRRSCGPPGDGGSLGRRDLRARRAARRARRRRVLVGFAKTAIGGRRVDQRRGVRGRAAGPRVDRACCCRCSWSATSCRGQLPRARGPADPGAAVPVVGVGIVAGTVFVALVDDDVMRRTIGAVLLVLVAVTSGPGGARRRSPRRPAGGGTCWPRSSACSPASRRWWRTPAAR